MKYSVKNKYKALVLDVDGTLIPNKRNGMPSEKVTRFIAKASPRIHISLATSRPLHLITHIITHLNLKDPCIINGGAQVINPASKKILWQKIIEKKDIKSIFAITKKLRIKLTISDDNKDFVVTDSYKPKLPLGMFIASLDLQQADAYIEKMSHIATLAVHKVPSWRKDKVDIIFSNAAATKQHGIMEVARLLKIDTHKIIGVGDGYNDFPLLMACGLRVAMGNAVSELKDIADYIAPSVEDEGVANVIERFIL